MFCDAHEKLSLRLQLGPVIMVALHVIEQAKQQKGEEKITASSGCG
jgi:hypothetical protein